MKSNNEKEPECCPPFDHALWDDKLFDWDNKRFIKDRVRTLFYMPLNFGKAMKRIISKAEQEGAIMPDWLCLSDHTSQWNMDLHLAVDKEIPGAENTVMSGKFFSKVYEGPFKDTGKWSREFKEIAKTKGFEIKKWYMWYTTCPKCAKKYGRNYVVILARVA
jgi:hypothetical protein